jgi:hypothetical protein
MSVAEKLSKQIYTVEEYLALERETLTKSTSSIRANSSPWRAARRITSLFRGTFLQS